MTCRKLPELLSVTVYCMKGVYSLDFSFGFSTSWKLSLSMFFVVEDKKLFSKTHHTVLVFIISLEYTTYIAVCMYMCTNCVLPSPLKNR